VASLPLRQPALPLRHPAALIATWFGSGLLPLAPGTWGSLAALPFAWAILAFGSPRLRFLAAVLAFLVGWWATGAYLDHASAKDPKEVVVDEVSGQWLALVFADSAAWWHWLLAFALFRFFDVLKPWPANILNRGRSAFAVMADDTIAALYAIVAFVLVLYLSSIISFVRGLFNGA